MKSFMLLSLITLAPHWLTTTTFYDPISYLKRVPLNKMMKTGFRIYLRVPCKKEVHKLVTKTNLSFHIIDHVYFESYRNYQLFPMNYS